MTALIERTRHALSSIPSPLAGLEASNPPAAKAARAAITAVAILVGYAVINAVLPNGLPFGIVVMGSVQGSFYALTAIGIVLIYRANRVINFAQADIGAVAGVLAIEFRL